MPPSTAASSSHPNPGLGPRQHVGRYRIIALIGVGASSAVYRALDEASGAEVAIKILADHHSLVPELRQRFLDEIALLSAIASPAVARVHDHGETEQGQPYLVLELADRGDLDHRVSAARDRGWLPDDDDLLDLGRHLHEALSALHRADIVHRDISPGNVLIGGDRRRSGSPPGRTLLAPDERYLLADLGFAKDLLYASGLTAGGGTRGFAAPEQRDEITVVDHRADVFSASALIEWLSVGSESSSRLQSFLDVGLAADPEDRHRTMDIWFDELEAALDGPPMARSRPVDPPSTRPGRNLRTIAVLLAVVAAVALFAAVVAGSRFRSRADDVATEPTPSSAIEDRPDDPTPSTLILQAPEPTVSAAPTPSTSAASTAAPTPSSTASSTAATSPTTASSVPSTGVSVPTSALTTTTFEQRFATSPRAFIEFPADESVISGDLQISGVARYRLGVVGVELVVRRLRDDFAWHDDRGRFEAEWVAFPLPVQPEGAEEVRWSYTLADVELEPGRYLLRVWALGTDTNDPVSNQHHITIVD